jgi:Heterokaryon incompatibility protein (HET)
VRIPVHEALLYTWGDTRSGKPITLSGHTVEITANLGIALRHLRLRDKYRTLWVDTLCIDQINLLKRSLQVLRMRAIFGSADMVLAWTGGDADGIDEAFIFIEELNDLM